MTPIIIHLMFNCIGYIYSLIRLIAEQLLLIFKACPSLLVDHARELRDFLGNLKNLRLGGEECYIHLVHTLIPSYIF